MLESLEDGSEDAGARAFYERQLALPLSELIASDVAASIASVAITGSDPYFRTGTDVAVLFECSKPEALQTWLAARHAKALAGRPDGVGAPLKLDELCITVTTADRGLSSYVTTAGKVVVVTNSSAQMKRVLTTARGGAAALASSPEYTFFRDRYRRGDAEETAFVLLTDATIRRWCSPRWRIGDARRTRAAARLADATAEMAPAMISGAAKAPTIPGLDRVTLTPEGVTSLDYGNLRFLRPIIELDVSTVTKAEAEAYGRFRETYEQHWTRYFDPIAIRLGLAKSTQSLDVTVMPLVASTDYRELIDLTKGAKLAPLACDPHDGAAIQFAFGLDLAASSFEPSARRIAKLEKIAAGWLKGGFAISLDRDPLLERVDDVESEASWKLIPRLPLMITAEVADPVALAIFLAGIRTAVEDTGVGSVKWTKGAYKDVETMTLLPTSEMLPDDVTLRIQYAIVDKLLSVSLREDQLHRAIDRALERRANPAARGPAWLGESAALRVDKTFAELVARLSRKWRDEQARQQTWRALPILTEWRRLFPDQDPVAVHERLFKVRLHDSAGGSYVVDRASGRIVSSTFGHPAETRPGPKQPAMLEDFKEARAGLTFENDGVRARITIERESR
jgi:hypothetical protein